MATLFEDALVWDSHAGYELVPGMDLDPTFRWRDSGVDFLSINVGYDVKPWTQTVAAIAHARRWIEAHPDKLRLIDSAGQLESARAAGQLAVAFDIEGMASLNSDLSMVSLYRDLGVRQMLIAYNLNNDGGGGCHDEDVGLSDFGHAVITEMNRVGMVVDCSHSAYRSTMDAMETSTKPCVFSHSNSRTLQDHERNILDDQMVACAATGGVVGLTGIGLFLSDSGPAVDALIKHIDYVVDKIGPEHTGISLDYSFGKDDGDMFVRDPRFWPTRQYPAGTSVEFIAPEAYPAITDALLDRGHSDADVRGILGENFYRVATAVWG